MQLTLTDLIAVKRTGFLPVFGYVLLIVVLLAAAGGGLLGWKLANGKQAVDELAQARADLKEAARVANDLRERAVLSNIDYRNAIGRMGKVAELLEEDRERNRAFASRQQQTLARLLDARPDLRIDRAGDDVMRYWTSSNAGATADATATPPEGEPAAAVPGAAAAGGRPLGDADRKPRRRRGGVPRLQERESQADRSRARMAGNRLGLVLQGGRPCGHRNGRVRGG